MLELLPNWSVFYNHYNRRFEVSWMPLYFECPYYFQPPYSGFPGYIPPLFPNYFDSMMPCPIIMYNYHCPWYGSYENLEDHCENAHSDCVIRNSSALRHDFSRYNQTTYIIKEFNETFIIHVTICMSTKQIYHWIQKIENPQPQRIVFTQQPPKFVYNLDIKRNSIKISKLGRVTECNTNVFSRDFVMATSLNGLVEILGGYDGTSFTIEIKQNRMSMINRERREMNRRQFNSRPSYTEMFSNLSINEY